MIPRTRLRPSSIPASYTLSPCVRHWNHAILRKGGNLMKLHLRNQRRWAAVFLSALFALGILVSEREYTRRKYDPVHVEQRYYQTPPSVNVGIMASGAPIHGTAAITLAPLKSRASGDASS